MKPFYKFFFVLFLVFASCSNDSESDLIDNEDDQQGNENVTYVANIKPIIDSSCVGCHGDPPVNGAPFALDTYQRVRNFANNGALLRVVSRQTGESGAMPPSGRLPQATIDLISEWIDGGLLEN